MNGAEVFGFTLREVPAMTRSVLAAAGWHMDAVDAFVMHQANRFMLQHLAKKMGIPAARLPLSLTHYGNTSSASIPLTICHALAEELQGRALNLVLGGFGVGLSWAGAAVVCGPMSVTPPCTCEVPALEPVHG